MKFWFEILPNNIRFWQNSISQKITFYNIKYVDSKAARELQIYS